MSLTVGDVGLLTQRETGFGTIVPGEVYQFMPEGRLILCIGPKSVLDRKNPQVDGDRIMHTTSRSRTAFSARPAAAGVPAVRAEEI